jgi:hypothetical protein
MSERVKEKIGIYKEIFKSLFALMVLVGGASFASLSQGKTNLWTVIGAVFTTWLGIVLILLWRYLINLTEEIKDE